VELYRGSICSISYEKVRIFFDIFSISIVPEMIHTSPVVSIRQEYPAHFFLAQNHNLKIESKFDLYETFYMDQDVLAGFTPQEG
jgi:hypothetical protein